MGLHHDTAVLSLVHRVDGDQLGVEPEGAALPPPAGPAQALRAVSAALRAFLETPAGPGQALVDVEAAPGLLTPAGLGRRDGGHGRRHGLSCHKNSSDEKNNSVLKSEERVSHQTEASMLQM